MRVHPSAELFPADLMCFGNSGLSFLRPGLGRWRSVPRGPSENKKLDILELLTEKLKSNGYSDMAQPASMEFDPFHCH